MSVPVMRVPVLRRIRRKALAVARYAGDPAGYLPDPGRPATSTPAVGLVGFYGDGNYGDELFLDVYRRHLDAPVGLRPMLSLRNPWDDARLRRRTRQMDAVVIGGGDLVVPWRVGRYWQRAFLARPVFVDGVGVAQSVINEQRPEVVAHLRRFFEHANVRGISARDPESAAWIRETLQPLVPVLAIPDLVCALDLPPAQRPDGQPIFGVAVRRRKHPDDLTHVTRMCRRAEALGYRVRRIVLGTGAVRQFDEAVTEQLALPDTELVATDDLAEISRAIGECSVLASMKFHGLVVATMYRVPTIVLMPSAKSRSFLRQIDRAEQASSFDSPGLPELVPADPAPLPADVPDRLRRPVLEHLEQLKGQILATAAAGYPPPS
jgi:polysaccharide pyruvyl transferase WcaK-like protein